MWTYPSRPRPIPAPEGLGHVAAANFYRRRTSAGVEYETTKWQQRHTKRRAACEGYRRAAFYVRRHWTRAGDAWTSGPCSGMAVVDPLDIFNAVDACCDSAAVRPTTGGVHGNVAVFVKRCKRYKFCAVCAANESESRARRVLVVAGRTGRPGRIVHLVLTHRDRPPHEETNRAAWSRHESAWQRLRTGEMGEWWRANVYGYQENLETTCGCTGFSWHPHSHFVVELREGVDPETFREELAERWRRCTTLAALEHGIGLEAYTDDLAARRRAVLQPRREAARLSAERDALKARAEGLRASAALLRSEATGLAREAARPLRAEARRLGAERRELLEQARALRAAIVELRKEGRERSLHIAEELAVRAAESRVGWDRASGWDADAGRERWCEEVGDTEEAIRSAVYQATKYATPEIAEMDPARMAEWMQWAVGRRLVRWGGEWARDDVQEWIEAQIQYDAAEELAAKVRRGDRPDIGELIRGAQRTVSLRDVEQARADQRLGEGLERVHFDDLGVSRSVGAVDEVRAWWRMLGEMRLALRAARQVLDSPDEARSLQFDEFREMLRAIRLQPVAEALVLWSRVQREVAERGIYAA